MLRLRLVSRIITGSGFQIALFRAYFATTQPKEKRTGSFGLIGVIQVQSGCSVGAEWVQRGSGHAPCIGRRSSRCRVGAAWVQSGCREAAAMHRA